ncbi:putative branched-chain amino acid permease (azaleucine resistance) [Sphaerochaeta pleomorpha str. Grapes]|uniref:Putative branched-chain amino acid permease (Azaleucine resistance) n=1 Tax=Sphaerochaeta pleomorpha (strain ATCC BAA-1885 / DSM 22778 / Grapes) TaxID=158190 RepID=G8QYN1_SPHPG|nr:AzlC family ABC transporter permease [Sphaerochaeta pleomorpha]AEV28594.1 putative branched-chain amino acid permease (azaleucine resistance) [Sphaerochaeta pleomorpha str. Grapes]
MATEKFQESLSTRTGIKDGIPICIGYFPTAMAFAIICRNVGLNLWESVLFSMTNFAGSGQFLAVNLLASGALIFEMFIGVLLINLRYSFMGAALNQKLEGGIRGVRRILIAHGTTDEVFSVAVLHNGLLSSNYLLALELTAYLGWVSGTAVGFLVGMVLPRALQLAVGVTLYAMFSSLFAQELRQKGFLVLAIAAVSALLNSLFVCYFHLGAGWSFVLAMLLASIFGAFLTPDLEKEQQI